MNVDTNADEVIYSNMPSLKLCRLKHALTLFLAKFQLEML
jgi:hypothetical protein